MVVHLEHAPLHFTVPKKVDVDIGMLVVPSLNVAAEARVEHIAEKIVAALGSGGEHTLPQQRRHHTDAIGLGRRHIVEREGQEAFGMPSRGTGVKPQEFHLREVAFGKLKVGMKKEILMPNADQRGLDVVKFIGQAGEQFIEIDHHVHLLSHTFDVVDTAAETQGMGKIINDAAREGWTVPFACRQEIGAFHGVHSHAGLLGEELRQLAYGTLTHYHHHNLVATRLEMSFQGESLREMSTSLALDGEKDFHVVIGKR